MPFSNNGGKPGELTESTLIKWKLIQLAAILPLLLSVIFLLRFRGSMLSAVVFFLLLIVGVIVPQVVQDFIRSHLYLKREVEALKARLSDHISDRTPHPGAGNEPGGND